MKDTEKTELVRLARIASAEPRGDDFWDEVDRILEENANDKDKDLVKPRQERE
jgi:hypothetical protein